MTDLDILNFCCLDTFHSKLRQLIDPVETPCSFVAYTKILHMASHQAESESLQG